MTEERKCYNCAIGLICEECNEDQDKSKWQPIAQKKPMENKVIFESEEECAEFLCNVYNHNKEYCLRSLVPMAKQKGYIRKTALEEAKERYEQSKRDFPTPRGVRDLADEYIQELKSEIARLKK
jgi:hypothetical protein